MHKHLFRPGHPLPQDLSVTKTRPLGCRSQAFSHELFEELFFTFNVNNSQKSHVCVIFCNSNNKTKYFKSGTKQKNVSAVDVLKVHLYKIYFVLIIFRNTCFAKFTIRRTDSPFTLYHNELIDFVYVHNVYCILILLL